MSKQIISTILLLLVYVANYLWVNGYLWASQMELASTFPFAFMPDGIVFGVAWTTIYILLMVYLIYGRSESGKSSKIYQATQPRFQISCLLNIFWMIATGRERYVVSVALIWWLRAVLAQMLNIIHTNTKGVWDKKHFRAVLVPFGIYYGWISLASSTVWLSQLLYQANVDFSLWQIWSIIVVILWLLVSVYSRLRWKNIWQLIISLRAIWGILFALLN